MVETFEHSMNNQSKLTKGKAPKVKKQMNKKTFLQNFGDYCNKQLNVPSLSEKKSSVVIGEGGDIGLFITLIPK